MRIFKPAKLNHKQTSKPTNEANSPNNTTGETEKFIPISRRELQRQERYDSSILLDGIPASQGRKSYGNGTKMSRKFSELFSRDDSSTPASSQSESTKVVLERRSPSPSF